MTLRIENGTFGYGRQPAILDDICIEVAPGSLLAVLGPNGVGKTTLLRCLVGLLPWRSGRTTLHGHDIGGMPARERWQRFAFVPQARNAASLEVTGLDMVTIGRSAHLGTFAQPSTADLKLAQATMSRIGIAHLRDVPCGQMSGGQFQMVLIARVLVGEPDVLVLDEPETGLDFRNQLVVLDLLARLRTDGMTIVMNTHYPTHALRVADRALLLSLTHDPLYGPVSTVITAEMLGRSFGVRVELTQAEVDGVAHRAVLPISVL